MAVDPPGVSARALSDEARTTIAANTRTIHFEVGITRPRAVSECLIIVLPLLFLEAASSVGGRVEVSRLLPLAAVIPGSVGSVCAFVRRPALVCYVCGYFVYDTNRRDMLSRGCLARAWAFLRVFLCALDRPNLLPVVALALWDVFAEEVQ